MKLSILLVVVLVLALIATASAAPHHHATKKHQSAASKPHHQQPRHHHQAPPTTTTHHHRQHHAVNGDNERAAMVEKINSMNTSWKAKLNSRFAGQPITAIKRQLGVKLTGKKLPLKIHTGFDMATLPVEFDSRVQWPECPTIKEIRDQSDCGSCWAFGAVEAASDRICIGTNGTKIVHLSATDLLSCCTACGAGCDGGDPAAAWQYLQSPGVVSGGNYNDFSLCVSYPFENCEHHNNHTTYPSCPSLNGGQEFNTPNCPVACDSQSTYGTPYSQDKHVFATAYSVGTAAEQIQQEILTNGPVEAAFDVYADFEQYSSGVYQHTTGDFLGGHAVKIIGWGVDAATSLPYWLVANSWNNDWGEDGFFRILRGSDECGIEDNIVAGLYL